MTQSGQSLSMGYDPNGNLGSKTEGTATTTYEWDAENRLRAVKQGPTTIASFTYDGRGRRRTKFANGITTTFFWDESEVLEERSTLFADRRYIRGPGIDQHLAMVENGTPTYFFADHLGSVVRATNSTGAVVLSREYDPWGNMLQGSASNGYAFTGREWDSETGLYYYRARHYDPKIGRFISQDPLGLGGGLNLYRYVGNRPSVSTDPFGLAPDHEFCENQLGRCLGSAFNIFAAGLIACGLICLIVKPQPLCVVVCVAAVAAITLKRVDHCFDEYTLCLQSQGVLPKPPPPPSSPPPSC